MTLEALIADRLALSFEGFDERQLATARSQLDPLELSAASGRVSGPGLAVVQGLPADAGPLRDLHRDAGDRVLTATDGTHVYLVEDGLRCSLPDLAGESPTIHAERGLSLGSIFRPLVRPALQVLLARHSAAALHSATVEIDGGAVVVAGWSESGKTETALALMERGARFLSDKWTVVTEDGRASIFPIGVGVRGWVLKSLPTMRAGLPAAARAQLVAARAADRATGPFVRRRGGGRVAGVARQALERAVALGDRAALSPSEIRAAYGDEDGAWSAPLRAVVVLTTLPDGSAPEALPADPAWAASRLASSAAFERRGLFDLYERAAFALGGAPALDRRAIEAAERDYVRRVLDGLPVFEMRAPFPTDPGPVAERIEALL